MKKTIKTIAMLALILGSTKAIAQNAAINSTGTAPDASAMLDVSSTTKGLLAPRMTSAQRTAISSPATGLVVYQTNGTDGYYYYDGASWLKMSTGTTSAEYAFVEMTGDGTQSGVLTPGAGSNIAGAEINFCDANATATTNGITWNSGTQTYTIATTGVYQFDLTLLLKYVPQDAWPTHHRVHIYVNGVEVYTTEYAENIIYAITDKFASHYSYLKSLTAGDLVQVKFNYNGWGEALKLTTGTNVIIKKL